MKFKYILVTLLFLSSGKLFAQQEPLFTQYLFNPMIYNPAYAGVYNMASVNAASRIQKTGFGSNVFTNVLTANTSVPNTEGKMGLGINFISDRVGNEDGVSSNSHTEVDIAYSYKIELAEYTYLTAGLQVAMFNNRVDIDRLNKEVLTDPNFEGSGIVGKSQINFGSGLYLINEEKFFLSFAVPRILNSAVSYQNNVILPSSRTYYLSGGAILNREGNLPFRPAFMVRAMQGLPTSVDLSASILLNEVIWAGASLRNGKTLALIGQFDVSQHVRIGYSTDLPLSSVVLKNLGTHEISVNVNFAAFKNQVVVIPRYF